MDKIPIHKLRRKPKPPAIETSIDRHPIGTALHLAPEAAAASKTSKSPIFASRLSPFRRLRGGKRARSCSPAASQLGEPVAAVVSNRTNSTNEQGEEPKLRIIPAFLTQSDQEVLHRFTEIIHEENERLQPTTRPVHETIPWTYYQTETGPGKNGMDRYLNIRPWSHNRVKLNVPEGALDYVNASPIAVPASNEATPAYKYIAMQGPTVQSLDSVWRMVAENTTSTAVIVQLTTMFEGEQPKCAQYFPFSDQDKTWALNAGDDAWGDGWTATLTYDSTEVLCAGAMERRKLLLHVAGEDAPRTVWHYLYLRWPDFGVPALTDVHSFFALMKMSRAHADADADEPRFIHCSAGVGRTGTFICLEHLMRELELGALDTVDTADADEDLVFDTVDALRRQRRFMVQSPQQYMFIYQVMRKLWSEKYGLDDDDDDDDNDDDSESRRAGQPALKRFEMAPDLAAPDDESASNSSPISDGGASLHPTQG